MKNLRIVAKTKRLTKLVAIPLGICVGCAYFNTFYNAQSYFRQGMKMVTHDTLRFDNEYFDKTIEKSTSVIVKYPRSGFVDDALYMMGVAYYYKGDYRRALEKLEFLSVNYPDTKLYDDVLYYKGLAYYKQQRYGQSIVALQEAMTSKQWRNKAMIALAYLYYQDHDYAALQEVTQELLTHRLSSKEKRWVFGLLGEAQYYEKQYVQSLETYTKLLELTRIDLDKRTVKLKIAEIYLEMGEFEKCQEFLTGEEDLEFRNILAALHVKLGNIEKAKEIFLDVALESTTEISAEAYYNLAELCRGEDSIGLAIAYYDSAINKSSLSEHGIQSKKMAEVLRRINALSEDTVYVDRAQFLLAEIYFVDFNELDKAMNEYEKVHTEYPASPWAPKALYAQLWIANRIIHDDSLAQRLLNRLVERYPISEYTTSARNVFAGDSIK